MNLEYALTLLKNEKQALLEGLKNYQGKDKARYETMVKHNVYSLEFAIEVLETYED